MLGGMGRRTEVTVPFWHSLAWTNGTHFILLGTGPLPALIVTADDACREVRPIPGAWKADARPQNAKSSSCMETCDARTQRSAGPRAGIARAHRSFSLIPHLISFVGSSWAKPTRSSGAHSYRKVPSLNRKLGHPYRKLAGWMT